MNIKFGTDGWRGLIDQDFNEDNVSLAAQAITQFLVDNGKKSLVIGYDGRDKADQFARLTAAIVAGNGLVAYLVDEPCPTPVTGWSIIDKKADGAIMFTASHNPAAFLGLKFMTDEAMVAPGETTDKFVKNLENLSVAQVKIKDYDQAVAAGEIVIFDPKPAYLEKIRSLVDIEKLKKSNLKVLINPMHGVGIGYLSELLSGGTLRFGLINNELRADFGGKSPEPIVEKNVADAIEKMKEGEYDICLSSDGDSDRIGLIDENGQMITSLEAFLMLAYYIIEIRGQKGAIVKTLSNTIMIDHLCQSYNLPIYETKVGFKYVGEKMKEVDAIFGGEESGGSGIKDYILVRDAQLMNLFILDLMLNMKMPISKALQFVEEKAGGGYKFKRVDVHFDYATYDEVKKIKTAELVSNPPTEVLGKKVMRTRTDDGIKIFFDDDSWLLMRFSGTEPVLRLYSEAKTMNEVEELIKYATDYLKS